ncbi:dimethylarginine dimethylaminohydrolase family protein [Ammoniphilus sp. CFH 90114]|uniref:dimethylarginine dimethylaminohydrolase family protein n=1 Tax=Ammoniphilus sp. CFH 90114 TaxID=2493665 RepID=UPI00100FB771|nr:arginine deiminase family protein [Ammoniphilus sp. CFH 90114]RXT07786.1 amidinotransferase [Ammoniphilus sp. CFH 90114]
MNQIKVQGERWFPTENRFSEEMRQLWGPWYCDSEVGKLRGVLLRRPGKEIERVNEENYAQYRWKAPMDPVKARAQQDALAQIYIEHGAQVYYVENQREDKPNALFMRDLVFMTPEGAIVCRPGISARRGEERFAAEALGQLGVPIIKTINGDGFFDGACAMWVDRHTVMIGTGARANREGAAQVEAELRNIGVTDIIRFEIPYGHAHLDGLINIADRKKVLLFPWQVPYDVVKALIDRDFTIMEATNLQEIKVKASINFVALEPGKVVMPAGCPETRQTLEEHGITVIEAEMDEILKGWGAIHCMSVFLQRDPV